MGVFVGFVGVDADAGPDVDLALCGSDHAVPFAAPGRDVEKMLYAGRSGAIENRVLVLDETFVLEVAMAIDEHQAASSSAISMRGNRPCGLSRR